MTLSALAADHHAVGAPSDPDAVRRNTLTILLV